MPPQKKSFFFTDFFHLFTPFQGYSPPLPKVQCPIFFLKFLWKEVVSDCKTFSLISQSQMSKLFRYLESPGKIMETSGLRFEHFCSKMVYNCRGKKSFFYWFLSFVQSVSRCFFPNFPKSHIFFFFLGNSCGKVMERSGLRL